jgi:hypothetical protein
MAFAADFEILFDRLSDTLRGASAPSAAPFAKIAAGSRRSAGKASRVNHLIEASAWTEAALALIELELPGWKLRRLVHENGEWLCSLSRYPNLPLTLDESVDASHEVLPLAILQALVEVRLSDGVGETTSSVPQIRPLGEFAICCDNFI